MPLSFYLRQAVLSKDPHRVSAQCDIMEEQKNLLMEHGVREIHTEDTVNGFDQNKITALMLAAKEGLEDITRILLDVKSIAVDAEDYYGKTALYYAASGGHLAVVEQLIEQKANPNKVTRGRGRATALIVAAYKRHWRVVDYLLRGRKEGWTDIKAKDANGLTVFHWAICGGTIQNVRDIVERERSLLNELTSNNSTALILAAQFGNLEVVAYLLSKAEYSVNVNAQNDLQQNALFLAIKFAVNDKESKTEKTKTEDKEERPAFTIVKLLVTRGADPNAVCRWEYKNISPLYYAVRTGQLLIMNYLLENANPLPLVGDRVPCGQGARKAGEGVGGATGLKEGIFHHAAASKNVLVVDSLRFHFKKMAIKLEDVLCSLSDSLKESPLHIAAYDGSVEICERFLKEVPQCVDLKRYDDRTALHQAAEKGFVPIVELLLKNSADPNAVDKHGRTPLHLAAQYGFPAVVKILLKHIKDVNVLDHYDSKDREKGKTPLYYAICAKSPETVALLLNAKADVEIGCSHKDGKKALHRAADHAQPKIMELLLKAKAHVDAIDNEKRTALFIAVTQNDLPTVQILLSFKANPDVVYVHESWSENVKLTALLKAALHSTNDIISALVHAGADVNVESQGKKISCCDTPTALDIAVDRNHLEMIEALLEPPLGSIHTKTNSKTLLRALYFALKERKYKAAEKILAAKTAEEFLTGSITINDIEFKPTEWINKNPDAEITPTIKAKLAKKQKEDLEKKDDLRFTESVERQRSKQSSKMTEDELNATELPDIRSWQFRLSKLFRGTKKELREEMKALIADGAKENLASADDHLWATVVCFLLESDATLAAKQGEEKEQALAIPLIKKLQSQHLYSALVVKGLQGRSMLESAVTVKNLPAISTLLEVAPYIQLHNLEGEFRFKDYKDEKQELKKLSAAKEVRQTSSIKLVKPELLFKKLQADFLDLWWRIEALPSDDENKQPLREMFTKIADFIQRDKMRDALQVMYSHIESLRKKPSVSFIATILNRLLGLPELMPNIMRQVALAQESKVFKSLKDKFAVYQTFMTHHSQRKVKLTKITPEDEWPGFREIVQGAGEFLDEMSKAFNASAAYPNVHYGYIV